MSAQPCVLQRGFGCRRITGIDQHGNASGIWNKLAQKLQPLRDNLVYEKIDAGRVAARPRQA